MERVNVVSSDIKSIGYDEASANVLEVEFLSGAIYQYYDVPEALYVGLMAAESHGKYFAAFIRNNYPYRQVR